MNKLRTIKKRIRTEAIGDNFGKVAGFQAHTNELGITKVQAQYLLDQIMEIIKEESRNR